MRALRSIDARAKLVCLAVYIVMALHARTPLALGICVVAALVLAISVHLGLRDVRSVLLPLAPILVITVIMQVLYLQQGSVLARLGPIVVTSEALWTSFRMLACLFALMLASLAFMRCTSVDDMVGAFRAFLTPFRALGLRVEGVLFSLSVALRFIPVLVDEFYQIRIAQELRGVSFDGVVYERLRAYSRLFAPLVRSAFRHADALAEASVSRAFSCSRAPTSLHAARFGGRDALCIFAVAAAAVLVSMV